MMRGLLMALPAAMLLAGCSGCGGTNLEGRADADTTVDTGVDPDVVVDPGHDPGLDPGHDPGLDPSTDEADSVDPGDDWPSSDCVLGADVSVEVSSWMIRIGALDYEHPGHLSVGPEGRILVTAMMYEPPSGTGGLLLLEIDGTGGVLGQTYVEGTLRTGPVGVPNPPSAVPLADCGMLLVGARRDGGLGGSDVWLSRFHHDGWLLWEKVLGGKRVWTRRSSRGSWGTRARRWSRRSTRSQRSARR